MATFNDYIITKKAASDLLNHQVTHLEIKGDRIHCYTYKNHRWKKKPYVLRVSDFKREFAESRQRRGKQITDVTQHPDNPSEWKVSGYDVTVHPDLLQCNCRDWKIQRSIGVKTATCKHGYSVLNKMGYGKLSEYLEARESAIGTNQQAETSLNLSSSLPEKPKYILRWETYAKNKSGFPLKTSVDKVSRRLTPKDIHQFRKDYHCIGFKLTSIEQVA